MHAWSGENIVANRITKLFPGIQILDFFQENYRLFQSQVYKWSGTLKNVQKKKIDSIRLYFSV